MNSGDTALIKAGTYGPQTITGDKASTTKMIGDGASKQDVKFVDTAECIVAFAADSVLCNQAANFWLENVTLDSQNTYGQASALRNWSQFGDGGNECGGCDAHDMTLKNVDIWGDYPNIFLEATNFHWLGGSWRQDDTVMPPLDCQGGGEPVNVHAHATGTILDGLRINPANIAASPTCDPHVEAIRLQNSDNVTISNNWFHGGEWGSGYIFTGAGASPNNIKIINNIFEPSDSPNLACQCTTGSNWLIAYNTWMESATVTPMTGVTTVGNFGFNIGCGSTAIKNVWKGSGSCGTDTFIGSASEGWNSSGHLQTGSPAIDAAETPSASDKCTDSASVNSRDIDNNIRPNGSVCDAGADEFTP